MNRDDVEAFEKLVAQLESTYDEMSVLSKRKAVDAVNTFKLKFINKMLVDANDLLGESYVPFEQFTQFDADDVPQNSDVVFIVGQYLQCLEKLRSDNIMNDYTTWYWLVEPEEGEEPDTGGWVKYTRTLPPRKLSQKK